MAMTCKYCPVRNNGICSYVSESELECLEQSRTIKLYEKSNVIISSHNRKNFLGSVVSGSVAISYGPSNKDLKVRKIALPAHLLIKEKFIGSYYKVFACGDVTMCNFKNDFVSGGAIKSSNNFRIGLVEILVRELKNEFNKNIFFAEASSEQKLYLFIEFLIKNFSQRWLDQIYVNLPISRTQCAELLGMTLETLSRELAKMKQKKVIRTNGHRQIIISDENETKFNYMLAEKNIFGSSCTII